MKVHDSLCRSEPFYIHYKDPLVIRKVTNYLVSVFPITDFTFIVLCIGTDRSTGDSLGPLTGSFLSKMNPKRLLCYGTLHEPVHAVNLEKYIDKINEHHHNPFIIAIDASLGKSTSIGNFISGTGSLQPGAALHKKLPSVGDVYITGIVNIEGLMNYTVLQSTRLSVVYDMAHTLSVILYNVDVWLFRSLKSSTV